MSENINKLYKSSENFDNQQQYKAILEEANFPTPEGFIDKIPISPGPSVTVKNPNARK